MIQPVVDVNVNLSRWPTRRLRHEDVYNLCALLQSHAVTHAWAGSFDGLLHKDLAAVNERLATECRSARGVELVPVGSINPVAPDWQEDLRRCRQVHQMQAVRVHPNYHGYPLDHPKFIEFLQAAQTQQLLVMLPVQMEDERVMHPLLRVKPVDLEPLNKLLPKFPKLKMVILNAGKAAISQVAMLARNGQVYMDIATLDGLAVIEQVVRDVPLERILFGSHAPLFYFESAILKLREAELTAHAYQSICYENAQRLWHAQTTSPTR